MNNNNCCSICIDTLENTKDFHCSQCKNYFHQDCINKWISKNPSCPICRFKFDNYDDDDYFDYEIDDLIIINEIDIANAILNFYRELILDFFRFFFLF